MQLLNVLQVLHDCIVGIACYVGIAGVVCVAGIAGVLGIVGIVYISGISGIVGIVVPGNSIQCSELHCAIFQYRARQNTAVDITASKILSELYCTKTISGNFIMYVINLILYMGGTSQDETNHAISK